MGWALGRLPPLQQPGCADLEPHPAPISKADVGAPVTLMEEGKFLWGSVRASVHAGVQAASTGRLSFKHRLGHPLSAYRWTGGPVCRCSVFQEAHGHSPGLQVVLQPPFLLVCPHERQTCSEVPG